MRRVSAGADNRTAFVLSGGPDPDHFWLNPATHWSLVDLMAGDVLDTGELGIGAGTWGGTSRPEDATPLWVGRTARSSSSTSTRVNPCGRLFTTPTESCSGSRSLLTGPGSARVTAWVGWSCGTPSPGLLDSQDRGTRRGNRLGRVHVRRQDDPHRALEQQTRALPVEPDLRMGDRARLPGCRAGPHRGGMARELRGGALPRHLPGRVSCPDRFARSELSVAWSARHRDPEDALARRSRLEMTCPCVRKGADA